MKSEKQTNVCLSAVMVAVMLLAGVRLTVTEEHEHGESGSSQDRLIAVLQRADLNDDQVLSRQELDDWVRHSYHRLPAIIAVEQFDGSDANKDGLVSWAEHLKNTFNLDSEESIAQSLSGDYENRRATMSKIKEDRDLFSGADKDGDGLLNMEEFKAFNLPEDHDELIPLLLKHQVGDRDKDGDGKLTFDEFVAPSNAYHADGSIISSEDIFHEHDLNKDGVMDREELEAHFLPSNLERTMEEVPHLLEEADEDKDGSLSFEEALRYSDLLSSTAITDYGLRLQQDGGFHDEL